MGRAATNRPGPARRWYRHLWPWLFGAVLVSALAGSLYTVAVSLLNPPRTAPGGQRTGLTVFATPATAELHLTDTTVTVRFPENAGQAAAIHLLAVTEPALQRFILDRQDDGSYLAHWAGAPAGVAEYVVQPTDGAWSLSGRPVGGGRTLLLEPMDSQPDR